jgi:UDP-glucose 4-epimerase
MASRGSVIPLFIDQIKAGLPLTVTDPNMTRFLMSLDEAVELVLHGFLHAKQGDIMVQKSPASTVEDLAKALLEVFDAKNPISVIGTRHGEKLFETLLSKEEYAVAQDMGNYFRVPADHRDLNYDVYVSDGSVKLSSLEEYNSHNTTRLNVAQIKNKLLELPEVQEALTQWKKTAK